MTTVNYGCPVDYGGPVLWEPSMVVDDPECISGNEETDLTVPEDDYDYDYDDEDKDKDKDKDKGEDEDLFYEPSEEDEDVRDLPEVAKEQHQWLHETFMFEPYFHYQLQHFYSRYPSNHPTYFHKVERNPDDDLFLQQLVAAQVPWNESLIPSSRSMDHLVKSVLVDIICTHVEFGMLSSNWIKVRNHSLAANDQVYTNTIKAAASSLYLLCAKHSLFMSGLSCTLDHQKVDLWDEIKRRGILGCSVYEFCGEIIELLLNRHENSILTEYDVADMLCNYNAEYPGPFYPPCIGISQARFPLDMSKGGKDKMKIFEDVEKVVMEMELPSPMQVDDYTRMLVSFLRGPYWEQDVNLVNDAMKIVDSNAMDRKETTISILRDLFNVQKQMMKSELRDVVQPLLILSMKILGPRFVSHEILVIVQVAELRRQTLGSRFIGRSHLIWALYECGYGLSTIRKSANLKSLDEDHPPYHIYVAAMKMAEACGLKKVRLEHFIFAILFAQDRTIFKWSAKQWSEMQQGFKDFKEDR